MNWNIYTTAKLLDILELKIRLTNGSIRGTAKLILLQEIETLRLELGRRNGA